MVVIKYIYEVDNIVKFLTDYALRVFATKTEKFMTNKCKYTMNHD